MTQYKNKIKILLKKLTFKIFLSLLLIVIKIIFFDPNVLMESVHNFEESENKASWMDWFSKNKVNILIVVGLIITGTGFLYYTQNINLINNVEVPVQNIDILFTQLEKVLHPAVYENLLNIVTTIMEKPQKKEVGLAILENILAEFLKNPSRFSTNSDLSEFKELLLALIEEIKKN